MISVKTVRISVSDTMAFVCKLAISKSFTHVYFSKCSKPKKSVSSGKDPSSKKVSKKEGKKDQASAKTNKVRV